MVEEAKEREQHRFWMNRGRRGICVWSIPGQWASNPRDFVSCFFVKEGIENKIDRKRRLVANQVQVPRAGFGRERLESRSSSQGRRESSKKSCRERWKTSKVYIWVGVCISRKIRGWVRWIMHGFESDTRRGPCRGEIWVDYRIEQPPLGVTRFLRFLPPKPWRPAPPWLRWPSRSALMIWRIRSAITSSTLIRFRALVS